MDMANTAADLERCTGGKLAAVESDACGAASMLYSDSSSSKQVNPTLSQSTQ